MGYPSKQMCCSLEDLGSEFWKGLERVHSFQGTFEGGRRGLQKQLSWALGRVDGSSCWGATVPMWVSSLDDTHCPHL